MLRRGLASSSLLDRLDRMEVQYREVAALDAAETSKRIAAATDDDELGLLAYKKVLRNGEDPRQDIARELLTRISNVRRLLKPRGVSFEVAWKLMEIERLNANANWLLIDPHLRRGLKTLASAKEGHEKTYGTSAQKRDRWRDIAETYMKSCAENPSWKKEAVYEETRRITGASRSTIQRALRRYPTSK